MSGKKAVSVSIVLLLLTLTMGSLDISTPIIVDKDDREFISSQFTEHDPIVIESDADFIEQSWPGNGTVENPYLIEGLSISENSSRNCITISDTRVHVIIQQCKLIAYLECENAVFLSNVTEVRINGCEISFIENGIYIDESKRCEINLNRISPLEDGYGIRIISSEECTIEGNTVGQSDVIGLNRNTGISIASSINCTVLCNKITNLGCPIFIVEANYSEIISNTVFLNDWGITIHSTWHALIINNSIYSNQDYGLELFGVSNSTIYANRIGWNGQNAFDSYGQWNQWDDNASLGNYWDDYNGEGPYTIEGSSSSNDKFPSLWDEDVLGPNFQCRYLRSLPTIMLAEGYAWAPRDRYLFTVNVTDPSEVDCVQIVKKKLLNFGNYKWTHYTMIYDPIPGNPNRYAFNYSFQEDHYSVNFHFLANDTLGNYNTTSAYWVESRIIVKISSNPVDVLLSVLSNPFLLSGILGGIIALIVLYMYKKPKIIPHYGPTIHNAACF